MTGITSSIGLISGIPIQDTVNQLVSIKARPRQILAARTEQLRSEQVAVTEVNALLLALQATANNLTNDSIYESRSVLSSNGSAISASASGTPALGVQQFTSLKKAQAHQVTSGGIATKDEPLGAGEFTFRFGGFINQGTTLDLLGGGSGFEAGKIRITDRSGASAEIDLRFARTVDDVLEAVNANQEINVTAEVDGDRFRLIDETGQTAANLRVQEVADGKTAQSLGLSGIDVAANSADGTDVVQLFDQLNIDQLNDGNGLDLSEALPDLDFTFRDGTTTSVDFRPLDNTTLKAAATTTAAGGLNAQVRFTAETSGTTLEGVSVVFENDDGVTAGSETVVYDSGNKTLTFQIDEGNTNAGHIVAALNGDATASGFFGAALVEGSDGLGVIDVADTATTALPTATKETTLGDIIASINATAPHKIKAELSGDGERIVLTDLTTGGGTFSVASGVGSSAAEDLGLTGAAVGDTITGDRLLSGLKTTLVSSLNGGQGLDLGLLSLTDRAGANDSVDLSTAETLDEVINTINAASVQIRAQYNRARDGIELVDTSGATASNLIVANGDAKNSADVLGLTVDDAVTSINGGNLRKQVVNSRTLLSSLSGGGDVDRGSFSITGTDGVSVTVSLASELIQTVGDVIEEINRITPSVEARINDSGDGIILIDTAEGEGTITVEDLGGGTTAADLRLAGTSVEKEIGGETKKVIDGATTFKIALTAEETLEDLVDKINGLNVGVSASVFDDGSSVAPFRLTLASSRTGKAGELRIDSSQYGFTFTDAVKPQDALIAFGAVDDTSVGVLATSPDGKFEDLIQGVTLTVNSASETPVNITVSQSDTSLVAGVTALVENYNRLRSKYDEVTAYNADTNEAGILQADTTVLRVDTDLSSLLSGRFFGSSSLQSLESVGISLNDDGTLTFDSAEFKAQFAADPQAVRDFLTKEDRGFAVKLSETLEQLGGDTSLLSFRREALEQKVNDNLDRIEFLDERIERFRELTLKQFFNLELALGKLQNNLSALSQIQAIPPLSVSLGS